MARKSNLSHLFVQCIITIESFSHEPDVTKILGWAILDLVMCNKILPAHCMLIKA